MDIPSPGASPPPGVAEDKPAPTAGTTNTRPCAAVVADGKPAQPVPDFDAEKWAETMVHSYKGLTPSTLGIRSLDGTIGTSLFLPDFEDRIINRTLREWRRFIADALRAAHAAGAASVKPRRWPEDAHFVTGTHVLRWGGSVWLSYPKRNMKAGDWWMFQPPSPEAAQ